MSELRSDSPLARLRAAFAESVNVKCATLDACERAIADAAALAVETFRHGGKLLAFGNGGSASDAQHLAAELSGRYSGERPALPALALTANSSELTALGNDYGFEHVFARLIEAHGRPGDLVVAISTSGSSPNVIRGAAEARERGLRSIGLVGRGGGKLAALVDVPIIVPSDATPRIQETHITVVHALCELVERELYPGAGTQEV